MARDTIKYSFEESSRYRVNTGGRGVRLHDSFAELRRCNAGETSHGFYNGFVNTVTVCDVVNAVSNGCYFVIEE